MDGVIETLLPLDPTCTNLTIYECIGPDVVRALAQHPNLTTLNLDNNNIGPDGARVLAASTTLRTLYLYNNNIGSEGAIALSRNTSLTSLGLGFNNIGPEGAKALALNTTLTELNLWCNNIGPEGAKALSRNTTLRSLYLYGNNIRSDGLEALSHNSTLTYVSLYGRRDFDASLNEKICRNRIIRTMFLLKKESVYHGPDPDGSFWYRLPRDIQNIILSNLFEEWYSLSIDRTRQQIEKKWQQIKV